MTRKISIILSCFFALLLVENINAQGPSLPGLCPFIFKIKTDNSGDVNTDGNILNTNINNVISASGNINNYLGADTNMDGNVLNTDIVLFIQLNTGRIQQF